MARDEAYGAAARDERRPSVACVGVLCTAIAMLSSDHRRGRHLRCRRLRCGARGGQQLVARARDRRDGGGELSESRRPPPMPGGAEPGQRRPFRPGKGGLQNLQGSTEARPCRHRARLGRPAGERAVAAWPQRRRASCRGPAPARPGSPSGCRIGDPRAPRPSCAGWAAPLRSDRGALAALGCPTEPKAASRRPDRPGPSGGSSRDGAWRMVRPRTSLPAALLAERVGCAACCRVVRAGTTWG